MKHMGTIQERCDRSGRIKVMNNDVKTTESARPVSVAWTSLPKASNGSLLNSVAQCHLLFKVLDTLKRQPHTTETYSKGMDRTHSLQWRRSIRLSTDAHRTILKLTDKDQTSINVSEKSSDESSRL